MRLLLLPLCLLLFMSNAAHAFCGFYVAKADGELFNKASKVVYFRENNLSVITMASDYRGAPKDFAMIIPTPKVLHRPQVRTVDAKIVKHLDDYTAPRLVEYQDYDPCVEILFAQPVIVEESPRKSTPTQRQRAAAQGVSIQAKYAVGSYDILILKAAQSDGLTTFLTQEGYKLPQGAEAVLADYIKMGMKFFVARVNLDRHAASETKELPPLQIRFRSKDFMLPIQLGKLNADGPQDALFLMLSRKGRVEPANYPVVSLPTDFNVPSFVEEEFGPFYRAMFTKAAPKTGGIVMEYAWDMGWCDPCAADPLTGKELRALGVPRLTGEEPSVPDIYVTRLHARYTKGQMTQDIRFRETTNRENFQGRFVMRHPFTGDLSCEAGEGYLKKTQTRLREEARHLSKITGWPLRDVERKVQSSVPKGFW